MGVRSSANRGGGFGWPCGWVDRRIKRGGKGRREGKIGGFKYMVRK